MGWLHRLSSVYPFAANLNAIGEIEPREFPAQINRGAIPCPGGIFRGFMLSKINTVISAFNHGAPLTAIPPHASVRRLSRSMPVIQRIIPLRADAKVFAPIIQTITVYMVHNQMFWRAHQQPVHFLMLRPYSVTTTTFIVGMPFYGNQEFDVFWIDKRNPSPC